ncbi:MAG: ribonuclease T [Gammaproteobacteria bacterium]|nr:ribonuclease T [Gammaproteobacteria bacterium]
MEQKKEEKQGQEKEQQLDKRFRGFFPVIVDVETGGFNAETDALLEIAVITLKYDEEDFLIQDEEIHFHVDPFEGANIEQSSLDFTGIDPHNPFRMAVSEKEALSEIFKLIRKTQKQAKCTRSVLVGHNPWFDLSFVKAAANRCGIKRNPFHLFTTFDTATLAGLSLGETVLSKSCSAAKIEFDSNEAHSALYDTRKTAELFCTIVNRYKRLGGWPLVGETGKSGETSG